MPQAVVAATSKGNLITGADNAGAYSTLNRNPSNRRTGPGWRSGQGTGGDQDRRRRREPPGRSDEGVVIGVEGGMAFVGWLLEVDARI